MKRSRGVAGVAFHSFLQNQCLSTSRVPRARELPERFIRSFKKIRLDECLTFLSDIGLHVPRYNLYRFTLNYF